MRDSLLTANAYEIQKYTDTHDSKRFYDALKAVYGPQSSSTPPLLNVDGTTLITDTIGILNHLEQGLLPESQSGFRCDRRTVDMVFAARQLQDKFQEQYDYLFIPFSHCMYRRAMAEMEKFGCQENSQDWSPNYMRATVLDNGDTPESFLAPSLFSMLFADMLHGRTPLCG